ncbi:hypothetical protein Y032_0264g626 [Ancylostoma ceylanicum]|uniref:Uncharacterized protein n=1 Tax=Ancylostoma ceylanicum TaxID=53326 RepID=A0A016S9L4_9BILA|nr:hypothetical protein Y032_0264g626 [Ancylostoma ceylanicum]
MINSNQLGFPKCKSSRGLIATFSFLAGQLVHIETFNPLKTTDFEVFVGKTYTVAVSLASRVRRCQN